MDNKKKIVVTVWLFTMLLLVLFAALPAKADRYFLSSRVLNDEQGIIQAQIAQKNHAFGFLRSTTDDEQMLKMLQDRAHEDGKWLAIHLGIILLVCNIMACLLYIFNMQPKRIVGLMSLYIFASILLVIQSLIRIKG